MFIRPDGGIEFGLNDKVMTFDGNVEVIHHIVRPFDNSHLTYYTTATKQILYNNDIDYTRTVTLRSLLNNKKEE